MSHRQIYKQGIYLSLGISCSGVPNEYLFCQTFKWSTILEN